MDSAPTYRYRTIWISDVHLGTRGSKAEYLLDFLKRSDSETLYLVGDIIDGWRLKKSWYWPQAHNDVVQKLLRKARKGTRVVLIPGNHDDFLRSFTGFELGRIPIHKHAIHEGADGRKFLVVHGDAFDGIVTYARWLAFLGDTAYTFALVANRWFNALRRRLGFSYWSLSAYLKHKVKNAVAFIANFEGAMAEVARKRGLSGVICGHIHHAEMRAIGDVLYCNDGDWVESCTALVEHFDGRLEILRWLDGGGRAMALRDGLVSAAALPAPEPAPEVA
ncbi:Protein conserved in bacteria [uncultured Alphaproteobacteria bacterium]|uniref:Protein conserved in bacteria n=1 Tax=uncultured Alphaproteobacteria bacterium TaxID=91750 RepID=A0A212KLB4_9PROT|nr:Protein conserved in bacteria [uncultured Alphaproteobacteria bacterium]